MPIPVSLATDCLAQTGFDPGIGGWVLLGALAAIATGGLIAWRARRNRHAASGLMLVGVLLAGLGFVTQPNIPATAVDAACAPVTTPTPSPTPTYLPVVITGPTYLSFGSDTGGTYPYTIPTTPTVADDPTIQFSWVSGDASTYFTLNSTTGQVSVNNAAYFCSNTPGSITGRATATGSIAANNAGGVGDVESFIFGIDCGSIPV